MEHRPINKIKPLLKDGIFKLSKTEYRFLKLLNELENPLTEDKIISFYLENVQMHHGRYELINTKWVLRQYTNSEKRVYALLWFDRNLGKMIRKQMLSETGNIKLNDLMLMKND